MGIKARDEMGKIVVKPDTSAVAAPAAPVVETKSRKRTRRSAAKTEADGAVHVGALLSALGAKSEDVFGTDSSWIAPEAVVKAMKSDKRMRPLHEAFSESIAVLEDLEADKENDVPFRCVDFLKARYGHGNFDATHLIQFGGAVYKEYKKTHGTEPPTRENNGYKLYFRRDIPVMQRAFDEWPQRLLG
eukprot:jgi/Mesvir1/10218/Mv08538-RA.1